ncbi:MULTISPECIES: hypothetical protein [Citrobacter]|nr:MULTISPECIES: hypothetical protein [Citrobacter]EKW2928539.1 hypothetical protein [Citrobacter amalonaticus]ELK6624366.1 hypothetical protein [Citrobacter amalonaticus]MBJ9277101.1 hypothetical protein [Citrobacter amalonaticus]MCR9027054.1 hypothetical protein [Citrobacter amalonaticus]MEC5722182.1 hypothetical protein [Citrobacter amalonaticus]
MDEGIKQQSRAIARLCVTCKSDKAFTPPSGNLPGIAGWRYAYPAYIFFS